MFLCGCESNNLMSALRDSTEALTCVLVESEITDVALPDPSVKTSYDNDLKQLTKYYIFCAENYAKMVQVLARADNQSDLAGKITTDIAKMKLDKDSSLMAAEFLIKMSKEAKPIKRLDFPKYRQEKTEAYAYGEMALRDFKQALGYARAISSRHLNDFATEYDKTTKETKNVGPAFNYSSDVQENMHRISKIANVMQAKNGKKVISDFVEVIDSWFVETK